MKISNLLPAIIIALQITPSSSAPVSTPARADAVKRQSQAFAQGDCTFQAVAGRPPIVSGDCGQGDGSASGLITTAVDSENPRVGNGGGTAGSNGGSVTGYSGGIATGDIRGALTGNNGSYVTTGYNPGTKLGNNGGTTIDDNGGTTTGNGRTLTGNEHGTTGSGPDAKGIPITDNKHSDDAAFPLFGEYISKLKSHSVGDIALPQLTEIIGKLREGVLKRRGPRHWHGGHRGDGLPQEIFGQSGLQFRALRRGTGRW